MFERNISMWRLVYWTVCGEFIKQWHTHRHLRYGSHHHRIICSNVRNVCVRESKVFWKQIRKTFVFHNTVCAFDIIFVHIHLLCDLHEILELKYFKSILVTLLIKYSVFLSDLNSFPTTNKLAEERNKQKVELSSQHTDTFAHQTEFRWFRLTITN